MFGDLDFANTSCQWVVMNAHGFSEFVLIFCECKVFRSTYVLLTGDVLFDSCVQLLPLVTTVHSVLCRSISCTCPYNTCLWCTRMIAKYLSKSKPNIQGESVGHGESQVHAYRYIPLVTCSRLLVKTVDNLTAGCGVTMAILWHTNKKTSQILVHLFLSFPIAWVCHVTTTVLLWLAWSPIH